MSELTFYFDRNFGNRFPKALNYIGAPVGIRWHDNERFAQEMPDDEWLEIVGKRDWVVFSHDRKFHSEATETAAVIQHKVGCFYLPCSQEPRWEKLRCFMRASDRIVELAKTTPKPFIYSVEKSGRIRKVALRGGVKARTAAK